MSILTALRAALEAKQEAARQMHEACDSGMPFMKLRIEYDSTWDALTALLTDDTIRAILDVAEAVDKGKLTAARHSLYPLVKEADHDRA